MFVSIFSNLGDCIPMNQEALESASEQQALFQSSMKVNGRAGVGKLFRRTIMILCFVGVMWILVKRKAFRKRSKLVSYSSTATRSSPDKLLEMGKSCKIAGEHGVVNNRHAIVLDAGSTGTRVHVYEFQCCGQRLVHLADELFEEVKPGLSSFGADPLEGVRSLLPLIGRALERIPKFLWECTPLVLKATAGLRLLPENVVQDILDTIRGWLQTHPFLLGPHRHPELAPVSVMDGWEEAVLAWVTVNFLQKRIGYLARNDQEGTSTVMDLGGGSTQIVFASQVHVSSPDAKDYYYNLKFHGNEYNLYQHSYLGYGLMEARKSIKRCFIANRKFPKMGFPCFPKDHNELFEGGVSIFGNSGGFDGCLGYVEKIFDKSKPCKVQPCSFNGIHQPAFPKTSKIVAFSYFYDRLIPLGLTSPVTLKDIEQAARELCASSLHGTSSMSRHLSANREWCLDITYIYSLLHVGYGVDVDTSIVITKQIEGYEAGWALGSALKLLEQHENTCPARF